MIGAVIKENIVVNLLVIDETSIPEMQNALKCEIIDAKQYGLQVGDLRTAAGWTRNNNGEQMILPELVVEDQTTFKLQQEQIVELEGAVEAANEAAANAGDEAAAEALAILHGEVTE